jgi:hypothetical protein
VTFGRLFLPLAATLLVAGCGGAPDASVAGNTFPANERRDFLAGCEDKGAPVAFCGCMVAAVEQRWSLDEFAAIMKRVHAGGRVPAEFTRFADDCAQRA